MRTAYGFWIFSLAASALWLNHEVLFSCFAAGWLCSSLGRFITMFIDKSVSKSNFKFVGIELGMGLLLLV